MCVSQREEDVAVDADVESASIGVRALNDRVRENVSFQLLRGHDGGIEFFDSVLNNVCVIPAIGHAHDSDQNSAQNNEYDYGTFEN